MVIFLCLFQAQWYHQGGEPLVRSWQKGDVVGCLVDMDERTMIVTLNGELMFNDRGSELAAKDFEIRDGLNKFLSLYQCFACRLTMTQIYSFEIKMCFILTKTLEKVLICVFFHRLSFSCILGLLPVIALGVNQMGRLNFGRHIESLQYFSMCGLQEGYKPFAVNMARDPTLWMNWRQPQFASIKPDDHNILVCGNQSLVHFMYN